MQYSTQLWDWDTYWTAIGLYNIAHLRNDSQLHGQISVHLQGCLDNFFDHQSPEGRLPIMIATDQPDFFQSTATQTTTRGSNTMQRVSCGSTRVG
jgi:hypothetical protein